MNKKNEARYSQSMIEIITDMAHNQPGIFLVAKRGSYARHFPELEKIARTKFYGEPLEQFRAEQNAEK